MGLTDCLTATPCNARSHSVTVRMLWLLKRLRRTCSCASKVPREALSEIAGIRRPGDADNDWIFVLRVSPVYTRHSLPPLNDISTMALSSSVRCICWIVLACQLRRTLDGSICI